MAGEDKDFFGMSDEDFAKLGPSSLGSDEGAAAPSSASEEEQPKTDDNAEVKTDGEHAGDAAAADGGDPDGAADEAAKAEADKAASKAKAQAYKRRTTLPSLLQEQAKTVISISTPVI